jgi:phospholipid transport system substrate-binding protein
LTGHIESGFKIHRFPVSTAGAIVAQGLLRSAGKSSNLHSTSFGTIRFSKEEVPMITNHVCVAGPICVRRLSAVAMAGVLTFALLGAATAATPKEEVQSAIEKAMAILKDPNLKSEAKKPERIAQLRQVIFPKFDFAEMAKRSLGANWQRRSPEEQQEFVKVFTELVENSYMDNIASYNGEKVTVMGEKQEKDFAQVNTKITDNKGEQFSIDYRLYQSGNAWKIYDVVIENISIVNNYRSQFNRVIARSSFEDLIKRMKEKQFAPVDAKQKT